MAKRAKRSAVAKRRRGIRKRQSKCPLCGTTITHDNIKEAKLAKADGMPCEKCCNAEMTEEQADEMAVEMLRDRLAKNQLRPSLQLELERLFTRRPWPWPVAARAATEADGDEFMWVTGDGRRIQPAEMDEEHLRNAISYTQRKLVGAALNATWLSSAKKLARAFYEFLREAERRGIKV